MKAVIIILLIGHWFYLISKPATTRQTFIAKSANLVMDPYQSIHEAEGLLKAGDIVVRLNNDPSSQFVKNFNRRDKKYSHAGIVLFENGYPYVYHMVNGSENPDGKLRKDSLARFCNPRKNFSFGIFRYSLRQDEIKNVNSVLHKWYRNSLVFDNRFDLKTDNKMYCSELVSKVFTKATHKRICINATKLTKLEANAFAVYSKHAFDYAKTPEIIAIDNLYKQPLCRVVKEYKY